MKPTNNSLSGALSLLALCALTGCNDDARPASQSSLEAPVTDDAPSADASADDALPPAPDVFASPDARADDAPSAPDASVDAPAAPDASADDASADDAPAAPDADTVDAPPVWAVDAYVPVDVTCGARENLCDGRCVNPYTDNAHCGRCGVACGAGTECDLGECVPACPAGSTRCDGLCTVVTVDRFHCGACGHACAAGEVCSAGVCAASTEPPVVTSCPAGLTLCGAGCANTRTDLDHCGACGRACGPGFACRGGECECGPGLTQCGSWCVDLNRDQNHCGACRDACPEGTVCTRGSCA